MMGRKNKGDKKQTVEQLPWGRAAGLLVACVSTMAGAIQGAGPAYLLYRACAGGVIACVLVSLFMRLVSSAAAAGES